ncbi:MAG: hypothetical protein ABW101_10515 [Candidatus Thiodiazotropha sp.]
MSDYFNLCCKDCKISLNLGKKISKGDVFIMQGMFSEEDRKWIEGDRAWLAIQAFLQKHQGHALVFDSDSNFPEMQFYDQLEFDEL